MTKWREWKARQLVEEMDVDPPADPDAVVQQKSKGKQKAQVVQKDNQTPIVESDSEIEILEYDGKGKGKVKATNKAKVKTEGVEGVESGAKFVVPMLPAGKWLVPVPKCFHQNDGDSTPK